MNFNQYKVDENGVGTPVIPSNILHSSKPEEMGAAGIAFNQWAQANTIQTVGVEPGVYDKEFFKQVWQYFNGDEWISLTDLQKVKYRSFDHFTDMGKTDPFYTPRIAYTLKEEAPADNKESLDVTGVEEAKRQILYTLVFKNPTDGSILKSGEYTALQLLEKTEEHIRDYVCICDCQPTGESSYVECNCQDYYDDFEFSHIEQSTQPNPELTRLKDLVDKYEKALTLISKLEVISAKPHNDLTLEMALIADNALNQQQP